MYLHIGEDFIVDLKEVVAILDIEYATIMKASRDFLKDAESYGVVVTVSMDMPKSFIVTNDSIQTIVYLSPISSQTLRKRAQKIIDIFDGKYLYDYSV